MYIRISDPFDCAQGKLCRIPNRPLTEFLVDDRHQFADGNLLGALLVALAALGAACGAFILGQARVEVAMERSCRSSEPDGRVVILEVHGNLDT